LTVHVKPSGTDVPVFSESVYLATLTEHSPLTTAILTVSATDGDTLRRSPVKYSLDDDVTRQSRDVLLFLLSIFWRTVDYDHPEFTVELEKLCIVVIEAWQE